MPGDILPAIAMQLMQVEQPLLLIIVPRLLVDRRVEVIIPSLSALFARTDGNRIGLFQLLCDLGPIVESKLSNKTTDGLVLLTKQRAYITTPRLPIHIDFRIKFIFIICHNHFCKFQLASLEVQSRLDCPFYQVADFEPASLHALAV